MRGCLQQLEGVVKKESSDGSTDVSGGSLVVVVVLWTWMWEIGCSNGHMVGEEVWRWMLHGEVVWRWLSGV